MGHTSSEHNMISEKDFTWQIKTKMTANSLSRLTWMMQNFVSTNAQEDKQGIEDKLISAVYNMWPITLKKAHYTTWRDTLLINFSGSVYCE